MDAAKMLEALREETLPRLQPARAALDRSLDDVQQLKAVRELMHKLAGTAALGGLQHLARLCKLGEDLALMALEGDAKPTRRLISMLDGIFTAIEADLAVPGRQAAVAQQPAAAGAPSPGGGRVVVASDEHVSAKLLARFLEESGFTVRRATLAEAAQSLPDCELVLIDAPTDSPAVLAALDNAVKQHVPTLAVAKAKLPSLDSRANDVLLKPVLPDRLEAAVKTLINRRLAVAAARAKAPTAQVTAPKAQALALKVLVVDDSRVIRGVVREALADVGLLAVEAADGAEALAVFDAARPDAVISDMQMPGVDGGQLTRLLRERSQGKRIPIVVLSSLEDEASRKAGLAAGADAWLVKSLIDGPALLRALKAAGLAIP